MNLEVPKSSSSKKRSSHGRSVTRFCDEMNISNEEQLDLAEFILAARYLGSDVNDEQLNEVFNDFELSHNNNNNVNANQNNNNNNNNNPKDLIKKMLQTVDEKYGTNLLNDNNNNNNDANKKDDNNNNDDNNNIDHEILPSNPLDAFSEDQKWQDLNIDSFMTSAQNDQNIKIARNLLATTALTATEIAEITGVSVEKLKEYESDSYDTDNDNDNEEDENDNEESTTIKSKQKQTQFKDEKKSTEQQPLSSNNTGNNVGGVTIKASDFSKSLLLTKADIGCLEELINGGIDTVSNRKEDALKLLTKLRSAIAITPGHNKRVKTLAKLNLGKTSSNPQETDNNDQSNNNINNNNNNNNNKEENENTNNYIENDEKEKDYSLPFKYRVIIHPGALCKSSIELTSDEVKKLPIGVLVNVVEIKGRRAKITEPCNGWCSLYAADGRKILQRSNIKSAAMEKAVHAERARQTKILILKSITTLNDTTVNRILEKSDWNLRRAIEAFYIAKYKTQEYINKKQKEDNNNNNNPQTNNNNVNNNEKDPKNKKKKMNWWKSWKTFANEK